MISMIPFWAYFYLPSFQVVRPGETASPLRQEDVRIFIKNRRHLYLFTIPRKWNRTRMVEGNAVGLFSAGRVFDNHSMKTLAKTPHIIIGSG